MNIILLFLSVLLLSFGTNLVRFKLSLYWNKLSLIVSSILIIALYHFFFTDVFNPWSLLLMMAIFIVCFSWRGAILSVLLSFLMLLIVSNENALSYGLVYSVFAIGMGLLSMYLEHTRLESEKRLALLNKQAKQLMVFKEVSYAVQQNIKLDSLLQTLLTSVTAGYGLAFNRAMIFLVNKEQTHIVGRLGIGPMTAEEGYKTWESITKDRLKLKDLVEINNLSKETDQNLNELLRRVKVSLSEKNFITYVLANEGPGRLTLSSEGDALQHMFIRQFGMEEIALFPLLHKGEKMGVLIVDNPVNRNLIDDEQVESVIPVANQAAIAIHHAYLYERVERLALMDGLTGLFNQRAFQFDLDQAINSGQTALILLDIDSFKHYNDTNGHLLGNEVLTLLADVMKRTVPKPHKSYRFGGEEFAIILTGEDVEKMSWEVASSIREGIEKTPFPNEQHQPNGNLTASLGVATTSTLENRTSHEVIDLADRALYQAKAAGKNTVRMYEGRDQ